MMDEEIVEVTTIEAVPKFASFRPKNATRSSGSNTLEEARPDEAVNRADKEKGAHGSRHELREDGHRSGHRSRHRSGHRRHHRPEGNHQARLETSRNSLSEPIVAAWENKESSFVLDVKGDPGNLTYGSINRYVIPSHHRFGAGSVLGLAPNNRIDRYTSNEQTLRTSTIRHDELKKRDKASFAKLERKNVRTLRVKPDSQPHPPFDSNADFLPLHRGTERKRKRGNSGQSSDSSDSSSDAVHHYKSLEGKAKRPDRPEDRDLVYASDASETGSEGVRSIALDEAVRNKSIVLSRRVDADPTNADAWLDLINHQDALLELGQMSMRSEITNAERLSTADIKTSIYERALQHIEDPLQRERMILGLMEEGAKVWETKKVYSKWRDVLEANPSYFGLWQQYLDFRQTEFVTFTYEGARTVYSECLNLLGKARSNPTAKGSSGSTFYELQLYVLLRMTLFMREAGYSEHALGIWQALLEYTFCRPSQYKFPDGSDHLPDAVGGGALYSFCKFWESEVPRIGEDGAMGWSEYVCGDAPIAKENNTGQAIDENEVFGTWFICEHRRALSSRWPARTVDFEEEDDPDRVVLFSDVYKFLDLIDAHSPVELGITLAAFLAFCHLPPLQCPDRSLASANRWWGDAFIRNDNLHNSDPSFSYWNAGNVGHQAESIILQSSSTKTSASEDTFRCPLPHFTPSMDTLFTSGPWFSAFGALGSFDSIKSGPLDPAWVRRVLRMLVNTGIWGDSLAEYYLALELRWYPDDARKTAKSLLEQRSSSLRLYNAYALIEYRLHNNSNAQKVIITAINMSRCFDASTQRDTIVLWRTWIWELIDSRRIQEALQRLLTLPDGNISEEMTKAGGISHGAVGTAGSAALLRARRALSDGRDQMLSSGSAYHAVIYAECLVLLTYLSENLSVTGALSSFQSNLAILSSSNFISHPFLEIFHQARARLLYQHATHARAFKPSILREALAESVSLFPNNTIFLSLYAWNESRFRIDDRVRLIVADVLHDRREESIITWFFSLWNEMRRGINLGSNVNAIRGTFERAVASRTGKCSAGLWKQYVIWEHDQGEMKRAKAVFWRGVRACPWAKEIYMLAFERLRGTMGFEELRGVYELLGEKELRVHVSLDDVFETWDERRLARLVEDERMDRGRVVRTMIEGRGDGG